MKLEHKTRMYNERRLVSAETFKKFFYTRPYLTDAMMQLTRCLIK